MFEAETGSQFLRRCRLYEPIPNSSAVVLKPWALMMFPNAAQVLTLAEGSQLPFHLLVVRAHERAAALLAKHERATCKVSTTAVRNHLMTGAERKSFGARNAADHADVDMLEDDSPQHLWRWQVGPSVAVRLCASRVEGTARRTCWREQKGWLV